MTRLESLQSQVSTALGDALVSATVALNELTLVVRAECYLDAARLLRDTPELKFEQCVDLCGVDYSSYGEGAWEGARFAVVSHSVWR